MRWLGVVGLLCLTYQTYSCAKHSLSRGPDIMISLDVGEMKTIKSLGYPDCCQGAIYWINVVNTNHTGHIRLEFLDLDIPPGSALKIHDGNSCAAPLYDVQPRYLGSSWARPIVESHGTSLFINFTAGHKGSKHFLGFKASLWGVPAKVWMEDRPFTDCPLVGDPMDGGKLSVGPVLQPSGRVQYMFDCIWQLKPPSGVKDLTVYIRIININLNGGGEVVIIEDITSEGRQKKHFVNTIGMEKSAAVFTSSKGFYIRLKKPMNMGHFEFIYGVYKDISNIMSSCHIEFDGHSEEGFRCFDDYNWCIPREHACNALENCPGGYDENDVLCSLTHQDLLVNNKRAYLTSMRGSNKTSNSSDASKMCGFTCRDGSCVPAWELCPGECFSLERKCPDGTCINPFREDCKGGCGYFQKRCSNGKCVFLSELCPQGQCPIYKPFQCTSGKCIYRTDVCDHVNDCIEGEDEDSCLPYIGSNMEFNWSAFFVAFVAIPLIIKCMICKVLRKNRRDYIRDQQTRQRNTLDLSYPHQHQHHHHRGIRRQIPVIRPTSHTIRTCAVRPFAHQTSRHAHMQVHTSSQRIPLMSTPPRQPESNQLEEVAATDPCMNDAPPSYDEVMTSNTFWPPPTQELPSYSSVCHIQPEVV